MKPLLRIRVELATMRYAAAGDLCLTLQVCDDKLAKRCVCRDVLARDGKKQSFSGEPAQSLWKVFKASAYLQNKARFLQNLPEHRHQVLQGWPNGFQGHFQSGDAGDIHHVLVVFVAGRVEMEKNIGAQVLNNRGVELHENITIDEG